MSVPVNDAVRRLAAVYEPMLATYSEVLRVVPPAQLHLTLGWLPLPRAADVTAAEREQVRSALERVFTEDFRDGLVWCGPAVQTSHGVRLDVTPDRVVRLRMRQVAGVLADVFGTEVPEPLHDPHIALAYGTADVRTEDLADDLLLTTVPGTGIRPSRAPLLFTNPCDVVIYDADTFATPPRDWTNVMPVYPEHVGDCQREKPYPVDMDRQTSAEDLLGGWREDIDCVNANAELPSGERQVGPRLGPMLTALAQQARFTEIAYNETPDVTDNRIDTPFLATEVARTMLHKALSIHAAEASYAEIDALTAALLGRITPWNGGHSV
ncbi:hypothetical protein [Amycolatopsis sp. NPDC059657]|uniref:hypothetical protein n=1 Tax=Amycolatopsis sp. NPDC059657 TaxID=3346899 RepID=UPI0036735021